MMNEIILQKLKEIELAYNIKILYACESGSRACGFNSIDSNYDVRFIYLYKKDWYLSVDKRKDIIELPVDETLYISGWCLQKTLSLLKDSNPSLFEYFKSPIVYIKNNTFFTDFTELMSYYYSPKKCFLHYFNKAKHNYRDCSDKNHITIKEYLCIIRSILSCLWIQKNKDSVPLDFDLLIKSGIKNAEFKETVRKLASDKTNRTEHGIIKDANIFLNYIDEQLNTLNADNIDDNNCDDTKINDFFLKIFAL
ncbi:MAG: nucleotidyltransferase domain-containing protein [bacterium]|nr:nucleotidyltransferase domain-containing protein [bacterium]